MLPLGKKLLHNGEELHFTRETLSEMIQGFRDKAFDTVYAAVNHTREADKQVGVLADLHLVEDGDPETDGLYGDFDLSDAGHEIVKNTLGRIGTSVSYMPKLLRGDGKTFRNALQHIAFTPTPAVSGLRPGEFVQMSEEQVKKVDLSGAQYSASEDFRKEEGPMTEAVVNPETTSGEVTPKELSPEDRERVLQDRVSELETMVKAAQSASERTAINLATQRAEHYLAEEKRLGVPFFVLETARPDLIALEVAGSGDTAEVVQLSADNNPEKVELTQLARIKRLIEGYRGTIEYGEQGREDAEPAADDPAITRDRKVQAALKERNLSMDSYNAVAKELAGRGDLD